MGRRSFEPSSCCPVDALHLGTWTLGAGLSPPKIRPRDGPDNPQLRSKGVLGGWVGRIHVVISKTRGPDMDPE